MTIHYSVASRSISSPDQWAGLGFQQADQADIRENRQ